MKNERAYYEQGFALGNTQGSPGSYRNIDRLLHKRKIAASTHEAAICLKQLNVGITV